MLPPLLVAITDASLLGYVSIRLAHLNSVCFPILVDKIAQASSD